VFPGLGDPFGLDIEAFNRFAIDAVRDLARPSHGTTSGGFDPRAYVDEQMRRLHE